MPGHAYQRSDRLRELLLHELAGLVRELKDPGLAGFLTLTGVDLSPDLKAGRVFYSLLGTDEDRRNTQEALERSAGHLRRRLFDRLRLKRIPMLSFQFDATPREAGRVDALLESLRRGDPAPQSEADSSDKWLDSVASDESRRQKRRRPGGSKRRHDGRPR